MVDEYCARRPVASRVFARNRAGGRVVANRETEGRAKEGGARHSCGAQRVVISADAFRKGLPGNRVVEHPAHSYAVDVGPLDAEADDAAGEDVQDDQHPMTTQQYRLTAEQVEAPEAILRLRHEGQPGRSVGSGVAGPVVLGEHAADDILVDLDAEGIGDLLGDADAAEPRITGLDLDDRRDEFRGRSFRTGLASFGRRRKEQVILAIDQRVMELEQGGRAEQRRDFLDPAPAHEQGGETEHKAIEGGQVRGTLPGSIADQKLLFEK